MRILIVEENPSIVTVLRRCLSDIGQTSGWPIEFKAVINEPVAMYLLSYTDLAVIDISGGFNTRASHTAECMQLPTLLMSSLPSDRIGVHEHKRFMFMEKNYRFQYEILKRKLLILCQSVPRPHDVVLTA